MDERVRLTRKLFASTSGEKNAHVTFFYAGKREIVTRAVYLELLELCLNKAIRRNPSKGGKNLVGLYFDQRDYISAPEISSLLSDLAARKGQLVIEGHATEVKSNNHLVGVQLADLVGYVCGRQDVLSADLEMLVQGVQKTGKARQLESSLQLLDIFKTTQVTRVNKC